MRRINQGKTGEDASLDAWGKFLTKARLAKYLGFSTRFIDMHLRPFLTVYKLNPGFGTKILFSREEVDRLIESRREGIQVVEAL